MIALVQLPTHVGQNPQYSGLHGVQLISTPHYYTGNDDTVVHVRQPTQALNSAYSPPVIPTSAAGGGGPTVVEAVPSRHLRHFDSDSEMDSPIVRQPQVPKSLQAAQPRPRTGSSAAAAANANGNNVWGVFSELKSPQGQQPLFGQV